MNSLPDFLKANSIFASFAQAELDEIARLASNCSYQKGEKIILYGDVWPYLFLVGNGIIEAMKESSEGRNLHVGCFGRGEVFWGLAFFHEEAPMPVTLDAREESLLYVWSHASILPILLRNGQASWELSRLMAERMQRASELVGGWPFIRWQAD
jgi:CRP-like cAMP-binding protein